MKSKLSKYARYILNLLDHGIIDEGNVSDLIPFMQHISGEIAELPNEDADDSEGTDLQSQLDPQTRKMFAANYTLTDAAILLQSYTLNPGTASKIVDPFCGSGRLILAFLSNQDFATTPEVHINDIMNESALLAYANILAFYLKQDWDPKKLFASSSDAFVKSWDGNFDLAIINPPFTRVHYLDSHQRERMKTICERNNISIEGQPGLHVFSLILVDAMLAQGGQLLAVLPLATLTSNYSPPLRQWILSQYSNVEFTSPQNLKSFSEGSSVREVIFSGLKQHNSNGEIAFVSAIQSPNGWEKGSKKVFPSPEVLAEWNWSIFFKSKTLWDTTRILRRSLPLCTLNQLGAKIVRGLEMYGPDFFFVPNENVREFNGKYGVGDILVELPQKVLLMALRKPGNYRGKITPSVTTRVLSIPRSMKNDQWLQDYKTVAGAFARAGMKKFGEEYPHHIHAQIQTKQPFSQLFFADKFGLSSVSQLCFYTNEYVTCSKNFYLILGLSSTEMKALAAWVNSTIYLLMFMFNRREIGGSYGRMQISDLKKASIFIPLEKISTPEVITAFDTLREMNLPPLPQQIGEKYRRDLDIRILSALAVHEPERLLDSIYRTITDEFHFLELRDNSR